MCFELLYVINIYDLDVFVSVSFLVFKMCLECLELLSGFVNPAFID